MTKGERGTRELFGIFRVLRLKERKKSPEKPSYSQNLQSTTLLGSVLTFSHKKIAFETF